MDIYHYTNFNAMEKILTESGLNFKAFYYSKYGEEDYEWTKKIVTPIIEEICAEKGWYFDIDDNIDPFFISFCRINNSDYMWECFNRDPSGVALILDRSIIEKQAYKDSSPDAFMDCFYTDSKEEMKSFLLGLGRNTYIVETINDQQGDLKDISTFIIKPKYREEMECRYVIPHRKVIYFSSDENLSEEEIGQMDYKNIVFPKEALVGITIGPQSEVGTEEVWEILKQNGYSDKIVVKKM